MRDLLLLLFLLLVIRMPLTGSTAADVPLGGGRPEASCGRAIELID
jgi:hypothetical protein